VLLVATLVLAACGGGGDGARATFERAEQGLARVDALTAHYTVHTLVTLDRRATLDGSEIPFERLHLARWAKNPRTFRCGHSFECARADLDVDAASRELEPLLPDLPVDPSSLSDARIAVMVDSRGDLHRIDVDGKLRGARVEVDLRPT
jgi:hypothetical protein